MNSQASTAETSHRRLLDDREYVGLDEVSGPIVGVSGIHNVGYNELAEIVDRHGTTRLGMTLEVSEGAAVIQVFEGTSGLKLGDTRVRFRGHPLTLAVSEEMLGRAFDGLGRPFDGGPEPIGEERDVNGLPVNPTARDYPRKFIQTGISAIDGMNTLVRGQKLPVFSGSGLPHRQLVAQITRQARIVGEDIPFAVVFAGMGIKHDEARFYLKNFEESGAMERVVAFLSLADAPSVERLMTPRTALTAAEYLAFDLGMHVLVILTDMTNYCEALREISTQRQEIPSRKGYPGYLYSDLASIYERAGMLRGKPGSITQIPVVTMPNDDISHPIPDLSGFITEGQIVLDRDLDQRGIYPPIAGLPSLSRLMKDGIGEGMTRADHAHLASQLFASYAHVKDIRSLASVIGEEELTALDRSYMEFGEIFEQQFLSQGPEEDRSIEQTLDLGWKILQSLPREELHRITEEEIRKYYGR
ncbi:MAG TPA: V-type ATP synthase subunit B [Candidatus Hydrogenedentes bacterium]|jgi:V/A-type H+-transporting ATPase subunit B|nr:V-type ATP synthase subunit B [Candidatus Hydrogenedentota bacterium]MDY0030343.1 V-type ATP synthase subunit B [FCB group bacterium]HNV20819.1 V-type ATP synthase subunit B [Candidatus Hydrogenedentota bacterium]HNZ17109.1 V-type ATP synthase subunit B [Candidatus Hydrogenedentota bacterium]HOH32277.1 V-type ATP synthase subunit B [Candidatus Hydrogenedentota bacterium]